MYNIGTYFSDASLYFNCLSHILGVHNFPFKRKNNNKDII